MTRRADDRGFTLIEVVIVVTILGIIMSALTGSIIVVVRTIGGTSDRLAQSHDAQLLSFWLIADIQSSSNPGGMLVTPPASPPTAPDGTCEAGTDPFASLDLSWTDAGTGVAYRALYEVDPTRWVLRRTFSTGGVAEPPMTVVHNLENPSAAQPRPQGASPRYPACIQVTSAPPASGKVTVTMTTLVNAHGAAGSYQFPFTVSAQTRQPYLPPAPIDEADPESVDANGDGRADGILVNFDRPVVCAPPPPGPPGPAGCPVVGWEITGHPGYLPADVVQPDAVTISSADNKQVRLTLKPTPIDTAAGGMAVRLSAGSLNGTGGPATFAKRSVKDGMAPILIPGSGRSADSDRDGTLDHVTIEFSEPLTAVPGMSDFEIVAGPDGDELASGVAGSGLSGRGYDVSFDISAINTLASGAKLRLRGERATAGLLSAPATVIGIADGMAPVPMGAVTNDTNLNGRADQVFMTFSEPLQSTGTALQWLVANGPSGASSVTSVAVSSVNPAQVTLGLGEGGGAPDTSTGTFTLEATPHANGLKDPAGNLVSFGPRPTTDGMRPVVVLVAPTTPGSTAGLMQPADAITLTFSEAVVATSLPSTMTVDKSPGNRNEFTVANVVALNMDTSTYISRKVTCDLIVNVSGANIAITIGSGGCVAAGDVTQGASATGTVRPASGIKDAAGNLAGGAPTFTAVLF